MKDIIHKNLYKKITYLTVAIIAAVVTVYLASPLLISTEINEPFPQNSAALVSYDNFRMMTEDERAKVVESMSASLKNKLMIQYANSNDAMTNVIDGSMNETVKLSESHNSLLSGSFIGVNDGVHNAEGTAKVVPLQQVNSNILRLENLKITNGPDLYVYLSTDKSASDIVNLGKLKANNGNQNYNIPTGTDLSKYDTVLIWCKAFSVLFGSAEFKPQQ
jgi:predicted RND superfamily exporter protein